MATLQQAIASIQSLEAEVKAGEKGIANKLLRTYKGIVLSERGSTELVKELRASLHSKVKN
ncbi:MAG: hypothetical protein AAB275_08930 [Deltaproteobacteria bacterium]